MHPYNEELSKVLLKLMLGSNNVFLVNVLLNLRREVTTDIPTAAVSATKLMVNPDFMSSLSLQDQQFVILHEASHIIFNDVGRTEGKDPNVWNQAADHYINLMLQADGLCPPEGCLCDRKFTGWEKVDIYNYLLENPEEQQPDMMDGDMDGMDDMCDDEGNPLSAAEAKAVMDNLIQQAAIQTKASGGKLPHTIEKYLDEIYNPKLKWNQILQRYMNEMRKDDYSWSKLNRRFLSLGIGLPTLYSEGMGTVAVAIDTSGSVSDKEYGVFIGGITEILNQCEPDKIEVISFTHQLEKTWTVTNMADINNLQFRSSGGTELEPVFEYFNKNKPTVLIIFSDMHCTPYTQSTSYDVINIVVNNNSTYQGIGKSIHIEV